YDCHRFETYVKSQDIDIWHIIIYGDYNPTVKNMETGKEEIIPYEKLKDDNKKMLSKIDEEYAMAVRDFKKFFRRIGKFVRQPDKKTFLRAKEEKKRKNIDLKLSSWIISISCDW
ncbi:hypothetical protein Tco_0882627, partial [Tanacetum coccineum]